MQTYDIGIGWADPVESAFVEALRDAAKAQKKTLYEITLETLTRDAAAIERGELFIHTYLDRGFLESFGYTLIAQNLEKKGATVINTPASVLTSSSKAELYPKLKDAGLPLPPTFLFTSRTPHAELENIASSLAVPFVVVSSYGLGDSDMRVSLNTQNADALEEFREDNYADVFLAHEYVQPGIMDGKTAWFRPLCVRGHTIPLWWDPASHYYRPFGESSAENDIARELTAHQKTIYDITGLELFSSEFAKTPEGNIVLIDYANTPVDLNSSENAYDGLPPSTIAEVARLIVG